MVAGRAGGLLVGVAGGMVVGVAGGTVDVWSVVLLGDPTRHICVPK